MPFVKGQSGNPAGRPRGCRNKVNRRAEVELTELAATFMGDLIIHARQGNPTAMRLVAERVMPVGRQRPVELELPALVSAADRAPAVAQITHALGEGEITAAEASGLLAYVRQALALVPASPATRQSIELAGEIAQLRDVVAQLAARLGEPGTARPPIEPHQINGELFSANGHPNNQENQDVIVAGGETGSMEIDAESMPESILESMQTNGGSVRTNGGSMQINEDQATTDDAPTGAPAAIVPGPVADAPPAAERQPVNIRENTGFVADALRATVLASPLDGPGIPMTISPDVLALIQESPVGRPPAAGGATAPPASAEAAHIQREGLGRL